MTRSGTSRLQDDESHIGVRVLRLDQQIAVAENAAARLVEKQVSQGLVCRDEPGLLPERFAGRRGGPPTMTSPTSPSPAAVDTHSPGHS